MKYIDYCYFLSSFQKYHIVNALQKGVVIILTNVQFWHVTKEVILSRFITLILCSCKLIQIEASQFTQFYQTHKITKEILLPQRPQKAQKNHTQLLNKKVSPFWDQNLGSNSIQKSHTIPIFNRNLPHLPYSQI